MSYRKPPKPVHLYTNEPPSMAGIKLDWCKQCERLNLPAPAKHFDFKGFEIMPDGDDLCKYNPERICTDRSVALSSGFDFREVWVFTYTGSFQFTRWKHGFGQFCCEHCLNLYLHKKLKEDGLANAPKRTI